MPRGRSPDHSNVGKPAVMSPSPRRTEPFSAIFGSGRLSGGKPAVISPSPSRTAPFSATFGSGRLSGGNSAVTVVLAEAMFSLLHIQGRIAPGVGRVRNQVEAAREWRRKNAGKNWP